MNAMRSRNRTRGRASALLTPAEWQEELGEKALLIAVAMISVMRDASPSARSHPARRSSTARTRAASCSSENGFSSSSIPGSRMFSRVMCERG